MHRRTFLATVALSTPNAMAVNETPPRRRVELDDTTFAWWHQDARLFGELSAPTEGWLAVGFNNEATLRGTRFVIGVINHNITLAQWHIADPPNHHPIRGLGGLSDIRDLQGEIRYGRSTLAFSLPAHSTGRFAIDLSPDRSVHMMLAWSHHKNFQHHSAWRRHIDLIL